MAEQPKRIDQLTSEDTNFKREIGVFGGVSIIGGIMIGSGIFYLGSYVLKRSGMNAGLALLCWIIGGIITLFGGLCYAELGTAMPKAGGRIVYLNEAFHPVVGFMSGFTDWLIGGPASVAAVAIAMITVLKPVFGLSDLGVKLVAAFVIIVMTAYNLRGVKLASTIQNVSMVAKLVPIGLVMLAALFVGKVQPDLSLASASTYASANNTNVLAMIAMAVVATLWAYEGWTNLNTVAEEIREPHRNLPLALIIGIGGITILYVLFNFAIMKVIPHEEIVAMINRDDLYLGTEVAKRVLGNTGVAVVSIGMFLAMFGCLNGMVLAQPRMYYAMAQEGHFFKSFAKLHPKYKVPSAPILVQGIFAVILVMFRDLDQLTNLVVVIGLIFSVLTVLCVPILRKKYPTIQRPYKVWFYPVSVMITAIIYTGLVVISAMDDPVTGFTGLIVPLIAIGVYYIFDRRLKEEKRHDQGPV